MGPCPHGVTTATPPCSSECISDVDSGGVVPGSSKQTGHSKGISSSASPRASRDKRSRTCLGGALPGEAAAAAE